MPNQLGLGQLQLHGRKQLQNYARPHPDGHPQEVERDIKFHKHNLVESRQQRLKTHHDLIEL